MNSKTDKGLAERIDKQIESTRRNAVVPDIGLILFVGGIAHEALVFDRRNPKGIKIEDATTLASDILYISNIEYDQFRKEQVWKGLHDNLCEASRLGVKPSALIKELGGDPKSEESWRILAPMLIKAIPMALKQVGYRDSDRDPFKDLGIRLTQGWPHLMKECPIPADVLRDLKDSGVCYWKMIQSTGRRKTQNITLLADRIKLGQKLLTIPVPFGEWEKKTPADEETGWNIADALDLRSESQDIIARVRISNRVADESAADVIRLPGVDETGSKLPRQFLLGAELEMLDDSLMDIYIEYLYVGPIKRLPRPALIDDEQSYVNMLAHEFCLRGRKKHPLYGPFTFIYERIYLYQFVQHLAYEGFHLGGYGSGKVLVSQPEDEEDEQRLHDLALREGFLAPVSLKLRGDSFAERVESTSEQLYKVLWTAPELSAELSEALKSGDQDAIQSVQIKLLDRFNERAG